MLGVRQALLQHADLRLQRADLAPQPLVGLGRIRLHLRGLVLLALDDLLDLHDLGPQPAQLPLLPAVPEPQLLPLRAALPCEQRGDPLLHLVRLLHLLAHRLLLRIELDLRQLEPRLLAGAPSAARVGAPRAPDQRQLAVQHLLQHLLAPLRQRVIALPLAKRLRHQRRFEARARPRQQNVLLALRMHNCFPVSKGGRELALQPAGHELRDGGARLLG